MGVYTKSPKPRLVLVTPFGPAARRAPVTRNPGAGPADAPHRRPHPWAGGRPPPAPRLRLALAADRLLVLHPARHQEPRPPARPGRPAHPRPGQQAGRPARPGPRPPRRRRTPAGRPGPRRRVAGGPGLLGVPAILRAR